MRNTITVSGSGGQTLVTANDGSNILKVNDTSYDTAWLNSASYTVTISSSYHVYISNDFAGESGNFYLVLDHIDTSAQYHVDYYYNVAKYGTKYVFGEKNEKFNLEGAISKSQAINTLKTNFQAGVDTIYSAEAAQNVSGVPTASTPTALADGVGAIAEAKRELGRSDKQTNSYMMVKICTRVEQIGVSYNNHYRYAIFNNLTEIVNFGEGQSELSTTADYVGHMTELATGNIAHSYKGIGSQA